MAWICWFLQSQCVKKKFLLPSAGFEPGSPDLETAVLLTELHRQSYKKEHLLCYIYKTCNFFSNFCLFLHSDVSLSIVPVPVLSVLIQSQKGQSVPKEQNHERKGNTKTIGSNVLWDIAVSYRKELSHVWQSSLLWDRVTPCGTEQSLVGQSSPLWDRAVPCGTEQSLVGQSSPLWDRAVSCGKKSFI